MAGASPATDDDRIRVAIDLARRLVDDAAALDAELSRGARARRHRLEVLVRSEPAADFTARLTDEVVRIADTDAQARRFRRLVRDADLSDLPIVDRGLLAVGVLAARVQPRFVMALVRRRLRQEAAGVIVAAHDPTLGRHLLARAGAGFDANLNVLGEAIVGDGEAERRLQMVLDRVRRPDVDYVSVKISAVAAGLEPLAFEFSVDAIATPLRRLLRVAAEQDPPTFVNLDMEEYRDLELTVAVFRRVLDEPAFAHLDAGIVVQAYLPDSRGVATELAHWAVDRRARGGGRVKIRLVKGANLAMETVDAEIHGWPAAPYATKAEVDANYKALLDDLLDPAFDDAVRIGLGSHNLFDVAWALVRQRELQSAGRPERIELEMLEGMAESQAKVAGRLAGGLRLYTPTVADDDFAAAIAYLVRRLDENTTPGNFLTRLFDIADTPSVFAAEAERFAAAVRARHDVSSEPQRSQDRTAGSSLPSRIDDPFVNAPDTDWTRSPNRRWIDEHLADSPVDDLTFGAVSVADVDDAVTRAVEASRRWASRDDRCEIIHRVGDAFEADRGRILSAMAHDAGKTVRQGDPEVSEAIDFARYYARCGRALGDVGGARPHALGAVVVTPPWNFPFAIPAGGVLAALAAGNAVLLKPAPQTVRTARLIAEACWSAGVPDDVLQFVPASEDDAGRRLVTHPDVGAVVLTGAFATARMFLDWRPDLRLHAETSGKNALVVTAAADLDRAVVDLVQSAFGHAGQKCSAASLAIVESSLLRDARFLERVRDAAASLRVGSALDPATDVGPLIEPPGPDLERALTQLDPGESWLLEPECRSPDRRLWRPGIRLGVEPGSWFARTECFGPVLGVVRADDLEHAIRIQNGSAYGLTAGLHSLDPDEIATWVEGVEAGNLYVNRGITGAIVRRQPFGGWKRSVVGPAAKAGGPNYVASLCAWADDTSRGLDDVHQAFGHWMRAVGRVVHDPTGLRAERNLFRYRRLPHGVLVRFGAAATDRQRRLIELAAAASGCALAVSHEADEPLDELERRLAAATPDRVRLVGVDDLDARRVCHAAGLAVDDSDPVGAPEVELPRWLREQAVSITAHRHGRLLDPTPAALI